MRFVPFILPLVRFVAASPASQVPLLRHAGTDRSVSEALYSDLEELARIVDISYCVGLAGTGIAKPFKCLSRCSDFPDFELIRTWNTGQLMSDSCGYIALSHSTLNPRIIVAFRGTYSIANTVVDLSTIPQEYAPYPGEPDADEEGDAQRCNNCTVHTGFYSSWNVTSSTIIPHIEAAKTVHPNYQLTLVGHSLGGAVAALAGLEFVSRGWDPIVTTFGEPRLGNKALMEYIDERFKLPTNSTTDSDSIEKRDFEKNLHYRRVTHIDDPVPLLPLSEWGYRMHAGEIYITKPALSPDVSDLKHCSGDEDPTCIAGQDASLSALSSTDGIDLKETVAKAEMADRAGIKNWGLPARYHLWQLFFAHRDYFWRLGLCVPGGDPWDWGREKYGVV